MPKFYKYLHGISIVIHNTKEHRGWDTFQQRTLGRDTSHEQKDQQATVDGHFFTERLALDFVIDISRVLYL